MMTSVSWPIHMKLETRFLLAAFKRWLAFNWIFIWLCFAFQHFPILTWVLSAKTTTIRVILFESSCSITFKWSKPWSRFNFMAKMEKWKKWKSGKVQKWKSGASRQLLTSSALSSRSTRGCPRQIPLLAAFSSKASYLQLSPLVSLHQHHLYIGQVS